MSDEEIKIDALQRHLDCKYADIQNGMDCLFRCTRVALLYPDEHSYLVGNKPKYEVGGYPTYGS
jgi:hypothetical protein